MTKKPSNSRRQFIKASAAIGAGYWVAGGVEPRQSRAAADEISFACVGVDGKGASDSDDAGKSGNVVAICDVDEQNLDKAAAKFPQAKRFNDFRKMFDEMGKSFDAVTVSTPDHCHALVAARAMKMGKHVYCQKPLTRTIWEARQLQEIATSSGVATQMGNQGSAMSGLREAAAKIKAGVIGTVTEVHVWTNRPVWPQGIERPAGEQPPAHLKWDEWIGPAEFREYSPAYHPFKWRGFWAFGTGALGDMACHTVNMPYAGCDLNNPVAVKATTAGHNTETFPSNSVIEFDFAANDSRPELKMFWYDGGRKPDPSILMGKHAMKNSGCVVVGTKGSIYSPDDYGAEYYLIGDAEDKEVDFVRSPGHFREFVSAIKTGKPAFSNFQNYAGKLTEVILLGNLAVWAAGESPDGSDVSSPKIVWDAENLKTVGTDAYDWLIKPKYREGYEL